jgi:uncharacterized protein (UPF0276 family)
MRRELSVGVSLMPADDFRSAVQPLLSAGLIDAIEWSFDMNWGREVPSWVNDVLDEFEGAGRLYGHGVNYSAFSMVDNPRWLNRFSDEVSLSSHGRRYKSVSEHYGFMRTGRVDRGAPLPVPHSDSIIDAARAHLHSMAAAFDGPIGLENLAFAFSQEDLIAQGQILRDVLEPLQGFLVLDVHNLYCQMHNFELDLGTLLDMYPLDRVLVMHVSGGSWSPGVDSRQIRRDTHDDALPTELFELLPQALAHCNNVELVVLERLGGTLSNSAQEEQFREDFVRLREIVQASTVSPGRACGSPVRRPTHWQLSPADAMYYQEKLLETLYCCPSPVQVKEMLLADYRLQSIHAYIDSFEPRMLTVGQELVRKWSSLAI